MGGRRFGGLRKIIQRKRGRNNTNNNNNLEVKVKVKAESFLQDDESIWSLVSSHPEACAEKYNFKGLGTKKYPLWAVCQRKNCSVQTVQAIYGAYPEAIVGALHYALSRHQESLPVIQLLCERTPDKAMCRRNGFLPIHCALVNQAPLQIVEYLLNRYPDAAWDRETESKKTCLHLAVENFASLNVVKLLVQAYPEALKEADYDLYSVENRRGWLVHKASHSYDYRSGLPLHSALKRKAPLKVVQYLVSSYPDAVRTKNRTGWLPLHYGCAYGARLEVLDYLTTACPEALMECTNYFFKEYPTHLACGRYQADIESIKLLIAKHSLLFEDQQPGQSTFSSYLSDAYAYEAPMSVVYFLRRVVERAGEGYSFLSTREARFYATTVAAPTGLNVAKHQSPSTITSDAPQQPTNDDASLPSYGNDGKTKAQDLDLLDTTEELTEEEDSDNFSPNNSLLIML